VKSLYLDLSTPSGNTPVLVAIQKLAISLAQVLTNERTTLELPAPCMPCLHRQDEY
jgi:CRISPR-associated protein Cas1